MKIGEIVKLFIYSNIRHGLTALAGALVAKAWITEDSISKESIGIIALALATYLPTVIYSLIIKLKSKYKFLAALDAEPGTPASVVKMDAAENLKKDVPIIPSALA